MTYGIVTTATLPTENTLNGKWQDKKETIKSYQIVAFQDGKFYEPVTVRLFMSRAATASVVYASFWSHENKTSRSFNGHGQAGGYGYDKQSAAIAEAIKSAGIALDCDISGVGEGAVRTALESIARALGFEVFTLVTL